MCQGRNHPAQEHIRCVKGVIMRHKSIFNTFKSKFKTCKSIIKTYKSKTDQITSPTRTLSFSLTHTHEHTHTHHRCIHKDVIIRHKSIFDKNNVTLVLVPDGFLFFSR